MKIFDEIIKERKRFLASSYLMRGQDDLERLLKTLQEHFQLIQLTSFERLAKNNQEKKSAIELFEMSNSELKNLNKTLELLTLDEEDVRYDIFTKIYAMLYDNIQLRMKNNKLSARVLTLSQFKVFETAQLKVEKENAEKVVKAQEMMLGMAKQLSD